MPRALPVLAVLALLATAAPVLADDGSDHGKGRSEGRSGEHGNVPVGSFRVADATHQAAGEYVSFGYDASGIHAFTVGGTLLFDAATSNAQARTGSAEVRAAGSEMRVQEPGFLFVAHDKPAAVARLTTEGAVVLTFAPGVTLTPKGEDRAGFTLGNLTGEVRADGLSAQGRSVRGSDDVLVFLDETQGGFDLHRSALTDAIGDGHVGAEATFNHNGANVSQDLVSYGNVTMTTLKAQHGNLTLLVEGHGTEGRVLVLNVDNGVLGAQKKEDLNVLLDNVTVRPADSLPDVLDPDNDGLAPEYYVVYDPGADAFQMIVSVPHYSVHTLSVVTAIQEIPPSVVAGAVLGVVVLVPSAFVLFRRPKA